MTGTVGAVRELALVDAYLPEGADSLHVRDSFAITPSFGAVWYDSLDLGFPEVREQATPLPSADGTHDETRYLGARTVTIEGKAIQNQFGLEPQLSGWDNRIYWNSASWWTSYLAGWAAPARRVWLFLRDESGRARYLAVRGAGFSSVSDAQGRSFRAFQLAFTCPDGKIYSFDEGAGSTPDGRSVVRVRQASLEQPGRAYPETGPYVRDYPDPLGATEVYYAGTAANGFVAKVHSGAASMTEPRVVVTAPDGSTKSVGISGVTIAANYTVIFDTRERRVGMRPSTGGTYTPLDQYLTAPVQWPVLTPGAVGDALGIGGGAYNGIDLSVASGASAVADIVYNNADLI